jgi:hypothetical protein
LNKEVTLFCFVQFSRLFTFRRSQLIPLHTFFKIIFYKICFPSCRPKMVGGSLANSVSFRHGTNVEFEGPSFVGGIPPTAAAKVNPGPLIYDSSLSITSFLHCNENPIYAFLFWELRSLSPSFHIHVSVSDLYIRIGSAAE